jgi:hypothetical protein
MTVSTRGANDILHYRLKYEVSKYSTCSSYRGVTYRPSRILIALRQTARTGFLSGAQRKEKVAGSKWG